MPAPTDSNDNNSNNTLLPPISAVPTSSLLEPRQQDSNNEGFSPSPSYGAFVPVPDNFLPLGGGGAHDNEWGDVGRVYASEMDDDLEELDPDRISATSLIYLCALCSSLTSVLLGYGKYFVYRKREGQELLLVLLVRLLGAVAMGWSFGLTGGVSEQRV